MLFHCIRAVDRRYDTKAHTPSEGATFGESLQRYGKNPKCYGYQLYLLQWMLRGVRDARAWADVWNYLKLRPRAIGAVESARGAHGVICDASTPEKSSGSGIGAPCVSRPRCRRISGGSGFTISEEQLIP